MSNLNNSIKDRIHSELASANHIIGEMEVLLQNCHHQFEFVFPDCVLRSHKPSPYLRTAFARIVCAKSYVNEVNSEEESEANYHRALRAREVCLALEGAVKAYLARAYIGLAQVHPGYKKFKALGEQALAYSQQAVGGNWEYYIPELLIWEDCELPEKQKKNVRMLADFGEVALCYALALHAQINAWRHLPRQLSEQLLAPKTCTAKLERIAGKDYYYGEDTAPEPYQLPRVVAYMEDRARFETRADVEQAWGCHVYDEAREANHYRLGGKWSQDHGMGQPKDRLAGFQKRRGGSGARLRRKMRREEAAQSTK